MNALFVKRPSPALIMITAGQRTDLVDGPSINKALDTPRNAPDRVRVYIFSHEDSKGGRHYPHVELTSNPGLQCFGTPRQTQVFDGPLSEAWPIFASHARML